MPVDLQPYRDSLRAGGLTAAARRPALYDRLANEIPSEAEAGAVHLEGLAFDAICTQQLGWALVCMGAAAEQFQNAGREEDTRRCLTQTQQILEEGFPPYRELSEFVQELRLWVKTRAEEILGEQVSSASDGSFPQSLNSGIRLHHQWWFRLLRTRQIEAPLKSDEFFENLGLTLGAQLLLLSSVVICEERPGGVPVELVAKLFEGSFVTRQQAERLLSSEGQLHRLGLVQLLSEEGGVADFSDNVWLQPHPDIRGFLLTERPLGSFWPVVQAEGGAENDSPEELWRMVLKEAGVLAPLGLKEMAAELPQDPQVIRTVCEQLSVFVWTQGQPGQPVPEELFRKVLDSNRGS